MVMIEVTLTRGIIEPSELSSLVDTIRAAVPDGGVEGVIISGRLPVWVFAALTHLYHPRPWVATFDPRVGGGIVVATHVPGRRLGEVVEIEDARVVRIEW
jgi:CRISPR-associated protein Csx3